MKSLSSVILLLSFIFSENEVTVYLKNGDINEGKIKSLNNEDLVLETGYGELNIPTTHIIIIDYNFKDYMKKLINSFQFDLDSLLSTNSENNEGKVIEHPKWESPFLLENLKGSATEVLNHQIPSKFQINSVKPTWINVAYKHNGELKLFNQHIPADTSLSFLFDTSIMFDLRNNLHVATEINDTDLNEFIDYKDVSIRGSFIVESSQLFMGFYSIR